jgi:hypothetical protein
MIARQIFSVWAFSYLRCLTFIHFQHVSCHCLLTVVFTSLLTHHFPHDSTDMERAGILTALRGEDTSAVSKEKYAPLFAKDGTVTGDWTATASRRFPEDFRKSVPENAQVSCCVAFYTMIMN